MTNIDDNKIRPEIPLVSAVVPAYNVEQLVDETFTSFSNQRLSGIEIICVDYGSTDDTFCIIWDHAAFVWHHSARICFRTIVAVAVGIFLLLEILDVVISAGLLGNSFIGFQFDSLSDPFSGADTQGRNEIWAVLFGMMKASPLASRLFGIDFVSDLIMVNGSEYGAHSLYVGTLFNLGFVSLSLLLVFVAYIFRSVMAVQERNREDGMTYLVLMLVLTFMISGISVYALQYSASA